MKLEIKQEHIDKAIENSKDYYNFDYTCGCIVAEGLKELFPENIISVGYEGANIYNKDPLKIIKRFKGDSNLRRLTHLNRSEFYQAEPCILELKEI